MKKLTAVRLSEELLARIDGYREQQQKNHPGFDCTRADVIRSLLLIGLKQVSEDEYPESSAA